MPRQDQWRPKELKRHGAPHKPTIPIAQRRARLGPVRSGARPDARIIVNPPWTDLARHRRIWCWARQSTQFVRAGQGVQRHEAAPSGASRWCLGTAPLRRPRTVVQSGKLQRVYTRLPRAGCRCAVQTMPTLPVAPRLRGEHPGGARRHVSKLPVPTWSTSRSDRGFNVFAPHVGAEAPHPEQIRVRRWKRDVLPLDTMSSWCRLRPELSVLHPRAADLRHEISRRAGAIPFMLRPSDLVPSVMRRPR